MFSRVRSYHFELQKCVSYLQEGINIVLNSPFRDTIKLSWLAHILKGIADRMIHNSIEQTKLLECFQEYEGCLLAANSLDRTDANLIIAEILLHSTQNN